MTRCRCGVAVLAALLSLLYSASASARPARVRLTNGEISEVEVTQLELGKQVAVRLSDGSERVLPWAWIASVELLAPEPSAPAPDGAPSGATTMASAGGGALAPRNDKGEPATSTLQQEYDALKAKRRGLGGPITLMAVGFGVGLIGVVGGAAAGAVNEGDYADYEDADDSDDIDPKPFFIVGGLGAVIGVGGLVWTISRVSANKQVKQKMKEIQKRIDSLKLGFVPMGDRGYVTVGWSL